MNRTELAICAAIVISLLASYLSWKFLILSSILAILYPLASRIEKKTDDHTVLACAKELRDSCKTRGLNSSLVSLSKNKSCPNALRAASRMLLMGHADPVLSEGSGGGSLDELTELISSGVRSGLDIKNSLDMFISKLELRIDSQNSAMQGSLNMNTLSKLGVNFFVPVFGGIGASIMSGSTAILGSLHPPTTQFELLMVLYVGMMSFVMSMFDSGRFKDDINGSFRAAIIAGGIIKTSAALMAYAI